MSSRNVAITVLVEDASHSRFLEAVLVMLGFQRRALRVLPAPPAKGSAEQYVRKQVAREVEALRRLRGRRQAALVVVLDGDHRGRVERHRQILTEIDADPPVELFVIVPTWSIETWVEFLRGNPAPEDRSLKYECGVFRMKDELPAVRDHWRRFRNGEAAVCPPSLLDAAQQAARLRELFPD